MKQLVLGSVSLLILAACSETPTPTTEPAVTPEPVSETAEIATNPLRNAYFGDVHIHTKNSFDAYIFNTRATPDDAYRFAKGETINHDGGFDISLAGPPLDFLAVTDHGEYLGTLPAMADPEHPLSQTATALSAFGPDATDPTATFRRIGASFVMGQPIPDIYDQTHMNSVWAETVAAAERHNDPGTFTTFAGYEFTAMKLLNAETVAAANLHRNVIFRGEAPAQLFTTQNSTNPEDLWDWMDEQRAAGRDALAIPHNSNASNGDMFAQESYTEGPVTADLARQRALNEPLVEITQIKGTSDTHPMFSPNDEWAAFEQYKNFIGSNVLATINEGDYVRTALSRGLAMEDEIGANPFEFGLIGASDTHLAAASLVEETFWGKFPVAGYDPVARGSAPPGGGSSWEDAPEAPGRVLNSAQYSASGLAGVWAVSNTREAIFDAMRRRETFGTSGPRMKVRFFGGAEITAGLAEAPDLVEQAYALGVPMGGKMDALTESAAPGFLAWAIRDPASAPLERLQVIKVWTENGASQDTVYDVACAGSTAPDPETNRCTAPETRVDPTNCSVPEAGGASELKAFWRDPNFQANQDAIYYVRVLEVETCRWSTWDAIRNGTPPNPDLPLTLQERAWSSPIWYDGEMD